VVELQAPLAPLIRRVFARVYGPNVDRAIPHLQEWFRQQAKSDRLIDPSVDDRGTVQDRSRSYR
jgi:hypothetical protein